MGKCLSCCRSSTDPVDSSNSSKWNNPPNKAGVSNTQQSGVHDSKIFGSSDIHSNGHSKMIGPGHEKQRIFTYPKIPQIRTNTVDSRRTNGGKEFSESKINFLFDTYKDPNEDIILTDGIVRFCQDLEVKPEEFKVLVLAWKFNAEAMCKFTRKEFLNGCKALKVDNIKGIQSRFPEMLLEAQDTESFKDLYRFTFKFGLDAEIGQRILPIDMAISLWTLVFSQRELPLLKRWISFLDKHPNVRGIPRDTWNMFLNFTETVGDDLSSYDDTEAWPSLFDDFVEHENDQTNQNIQQSKDGNITE